MSASPPTGTPDVSGEETYELAHPGRAVAVALVLLAVVIALAVAAASSPSPLGLDRAWADLAITHRTAALTFIAKGVFDPVGRFPLSWLIVAIAAVILWHERRRRAIAVLLIGETVSWAVNNLIKVGVDRPRPSGALIEASRSSFPSGHAAFAGVTAVLLVGLLVPTGRRVVPALIATTVALMMAWSRTFLLVHWFTDVIAGLCVGVAVGSLTLALMHTSADRTD